MQIRFLVNSNSESCGDRISGKCTVVPSWQPQSNTLVWDHRAGTWQRLKEGKFLTKRTRLLPSCQAMLSCPFQQDAKAEDEGHQSNVMISRRWQKYNWRLFKPERGFIGLWELIIKRKCIPQLKYSDLRDDLIPEFRRYYWDSFFFSFSPLALHSSGLALFVSTKNGEDWEKNSSGPEGINFSVEERVLSLFLGIPWLPKEENASLS